MGFHVDYIFIDRDVVDEIVASPWSTLIQQRRVTQRDAANVLKTYFDGWQGPEGNQAEIESILRNRTVHWSMKRSHSQYFFLPEVWSVTKIKVKSPFRHVEADMEHPVLLATAIEAFFQGMMDRPALNAVLKLNAIAFPTDWVELTKREQRLLAQGWNPDEMARPIYSWQGTEAHLDSGGDTGLGILETRRLLRFLRAAWENNWSVPRLDPKLLQRSKQSARSVPHFRDFQIALDLHKALASWRPRRPSVFRTAG